MHSGNIRSAKPALKKRFSRFSQYEFPDSAFTVYMSLRNSGNMGRSVSDPNREPFYNFAGVARSSVLSLKQIHSKRIVHADDWYDGIEADGIVSADQSNTLGITSADCLPVFIFHPRLCCFGAFHSGWKGTGIVSEGLKMLEVLSGCPAEEFAAFIGPGIGSCCYNVDEERGRMFLLEFGSSAVIQRQGNWYLDLRSANIELLSHAGISMIYTESDCTVCNASYGSYRREGPAEYTLMLALGLYEPE